MNVKIRYNLLKLYANMKIKHNLLKLNMNIPKIAIKIARKIANRCVSPTMLIQRFYTVNDKVICF